MVFFLLLLERFNRNYILIFVKLTAANWLKIIIWVQSDYFWAIIRWTRVVGSATSFCTNNSTKLAAYDVISATFYCDKREFVQLISAWYTCNWRMNIIFLVVLFDKSGMLEMGDLLVITRLVVVIRLNNSRIWSN